MCASLLACVPASSTDEDSDNETVRLSPGSDSEVDVVQLLSSAASEQRAGGPPAAGCGVMLEVEPLCVAPAGASVSICAVSVLAEECVVPESECAAECVMRDVCEGAESPRCGGARGAVVVAADERVPSSLSSVLSSDVGMSPVGNGGVVVVEKMLGGNA